ncbi:unnamed protein product [Ectocarpus sp. 6 AP-2014]
MKRVFLRLSCLYLAPHPSNKIVSNTRGRRSRPPLPLAPSNTASFLKPTSVLDLFVVVVFFSPQNEHPSHGPIVYLVVTTYCRLHTARTGSSTRKYIARARWDSFSSIASYRGNKVAGDGSVLYFFESRSSGFARHACQRFEEKGAQQSSLVFLLTLHNGLTHHRHTY